MQALRVLKNRWWRRALITIVIGGAWLAVRAVAPEGDAAGVLGVLAVLWLALLAFLAAHWLWHRLTYRVGVRLVLSYLLIGLVPFPLLGGLGALAAFMVIGQYAAQRGSEVVAAVETALMAQVDQLAAAPASARFEVPADWAPAGMSLPAPAWVVDEGRREQRSADAPPVAVPRWVGADGWHGVVLTTTGPALAAAARRGERVAAVLLPLRAEVAAALSAGRWFDVRFTDARIAKSAADGEVNIQLGSEQERGVRVGGESVGSSQVEENWQTAAGSGRLLDRRVVLWVRILPAPLDWEKGESDASRRAVMLVKASPAGAWHDLFPSGSEMGRDVLTALTYMSGVFGVLYVIAIGFAALMIFSIARSTARLTRGSRQVANGNLDWRIPVKRHDQLGDLAASFNTMTASVQRMLAEVGEKERMARELELAREIQESLLPAREFTHGGLSVHSVFRPAAEVGGDYFDLFPLADGRLTIAIGDVAGHGLSTGLLMAMVKSAVAALIQQGRRGGELLVDLNRLVAQHPVRHRMVTLALIEVDESAGTVEITNGGHPPPFVLRRGQPPEEVLLPALPLGQHWRDLPASHRTSFPPGSRLVLYSDGLVEAAGPDGQPYGYAALEKLLAREAGRSAGQLIDSILAELERFTGGTKLDDDLTILIVESAGQAS
jgi:serine phosphatase RsbU (regulator of sigma subunit)